MGFFKLTNVQISIKKYYELNQRKKILGTCQSVWLDKRVMTYENRTIFAIQSKSYISLTIYQHNTLLNVYFVN